MNQQNKMSTNVSPEFAAAQKKYLYAQTDEERLIFLEEMISQAPSHKGGENLRAELRARHKKLKEKMQERIKKKKSLAKKEGIKKEGVQIVLIGLTNSGKSSLTSKLTNAKPHISNYNYTTKSPTIGMLNHEGINFQIIDMPAIDDENFDTGISHTADILLIVISNPQEIQKIYPFLEKLKNKKIIALNKSDLLSQEEKRKISSFLQSKKFQFAMISCKTGEGIEDLKKKLLENSGVIRVYTKQPGKQADENPVIMKPESTIKNLAEKIFPKNIQIKEIKLTGPSSKFPNQKVGIEHILKDKDIVEFHAR